MHGRPGARQQNVRLARILASQNSLRREMTYSKARHLCLCPLLGRLPADKQSAARRSIRTSQGDHFLLGFRYWPKLLASLKPLQAAPHLEIRRRAREKPTITLRYFPDWPCCRSDLRRPRRDPKRRARSVRNHGGHAVGRTSANTPDDRGHHIVHMYAVADNGQL